MRGIHRWPVISPYKWPVTLKMFPFDDVIMAPPWYGMRGGGRLCKFRIYIIIRWCTKHRRSPIAAISNLTAYCVVLDRNVSRGYCISCCIFGERYSTILWICSGKYSGLNFLRIGWSECVYHYPHGVNECIWISYTNLSNSIDMLRCDLVVIYYISKFENW